MTLFANSGVAWPKHEAKTKDAGKKSFDAASQLFKILGILEGNQPQPMINENELNACAQSLDEAAQAYATIGNDLSNEVVDSMTPSEVELAAVPRYYRRLPDDDYYDLPFSYRGRMSIGALYRELSHRLSRLATSIRALKTSEQSFDLAPQVFEMLWLWESASTLGRLIATLGRRKPSGAG